jgi:hypothetical protein
VRRVQTLPHTQEKAESEKVRWRDWCVQTPTTPREGREREGEVWRTGLQTKPEKARALR